MCNLTCSAVWLPAAAAAPEEFGLALCRAVTLRRVGGDREEREEEEQQREQEQQKQQEGEE